MSPNEMVREFMVKFERPVDVGFNEKDILLCSRLIREESDEVNDHLVVVRIGPPAAQRNRTLYEPPTFADPAELTKELCDLIYVCYYTANKFGLPIEEAFKRVHESNLSKLDNDGKPILREDGKILKSENYKPADLKDLFVD